MSIFLKEPVGIIFVFSFLFVSPIHALLIGPLKSDIDQQKYDNLFNEKQENKKSVSHESLPQGDRPLKLQLTKKMYTKICNEELSQERLAKATTYFEKRLKEDLSIPLNYDHLPEREKEIANAVRNVSIAGLGVFSVLFALPVEYTNWPDDKSFSDLIDDYDDNIKSGPVVDKDSWVFNYFIHPMSGAYLYQVLRNKGFSKMESFGFAVFASTVIWEYGIEATIEPPSIQDLLITPIVGSMLGEVFYKWDQKLKEKNYRIAGSKKLGRIIHYIINPVEGINNSMNQFFRVKFLRLQKAHFYLRDQNQRFREAEYNGNNLDEDWAFGVRFLFTF